MPFAFRDRRRGAHWAPVLSCTFCMAFCGRAILLPAGGRWPPLRKAPADGDTFTEIPSVSSTATGTLHAFLKTQPQFGGAPRRSMIGCVRRRKKAAHPLPRAKPKEERCVNNIHILLPKGKRRAALPASFPSAPKRKNHLISSLLRVIRAALPFQIYAGAKRRNG